VTETGLKTEAAAPAREARALDLASLRALVRERLADAPVALPPERSAAAS
jgi:hypothetical protein